jgi:hypothetical protein
VAKAVYQREYCVVLPDGRIRWIASCGRVEFDGTSKPVLMCGVSLDDTARRLADQDRYGFALQSTNYPSLMSEQKMNKNRSCRKEPGSCYRPRSRMRWDRGIEWGKVSAAGSVLIVPLTVLFYSIQRFLIRTLSLGVIAG